MRLPFFALYHQEIVFKILEHIVIRHVLIDENKSFRLSRHRYMCRPLRRRLTIEGIKTTEYGVHALRIFQVCRESFFNVKLELPVESSLSESSDSYITIF